MKVAGINGIVYVLLVCTGIEVCGVLAGAIVAGVTDLRPIWELAVGNLIGNYVCAD
jgi:hypothetical protein